MQPQVHDRNFDPYAHYSKGRDDDVDGWRDNAEVRAQSDDELSNHMHELVQAEENEKAEALAESARVSQQSSRSKNKKMTKKPSRSRLRKGESKANIKGDDITASIDRQSKAPSGKQDVTGTFYRKDDEEIEANEHILVCNLDDTDGGSN